MCSMYLHHFTLTAESTVAELQTSKEHMPYLKESIIRAFHLTIHLIGISIVFLIRISNLQTSISQISCIPNHLQSRPTQHKPPPDPCPPKHQKQHPQRNPGLQPITSPSPQLYLCLFKGSFLADKGLHSDFASF